MDYLDNLDARRARSRGMTNQVNAKHWPDGRGGLDELKEKLGIGGREKREEGGRSDHEEENMKTSEERKTIE